MISIDDQLLRRLDRAAKARRLSRSAYLSLKGALARLDRLFEKAPPGDATAEIRSERDAR
ncbi:MAG: ribbon-helix-helix protein, CopG family [Candidatus Baltobacteraceae bacterium]